MNYYLQLILAIFIFGFGIGSAVICLSSYLKLEIKKEINNYYANTILQLSQNILEVEKVINRRPRRHYPKRHKICK